MGVFLDLTKTSRRMNMNDKVMKHKKIGMVWWIYMGRSAEVMDNMNTGLINAFFY